MTFTTQTARQRRLTEERGSDVWPFGWKWSLPNPFHHGNGGTSSRQKLENNGDVQYTGIVKVGGQSLKAVIDTGSFELVVFGKNCTSCGRPKHLYDEKQSKSYQHGGFKGIHTYGSGTTYSEESFETVSIGKHLSVPNQSFWEVYDANMPILAADSFQMIFGIGPPASVEKMAALDAEEAHKELDEYSKSVDGEISSEITDMVHYYDMAKDHAKNIKSASANLLLGNVSVCLGKKGGSGGFMVWNETATSEEPEKFTELQVVGDLYWSANLTNVVVGSRESRGGHGPANIVGCAASATCSAVIDTGTSLITAPSEAVSSLQLLVDAWVDQGGSCDDLGGLPDLEFQLNGIKFSLPPQAYIGRMEGEYDDHIQRFMPHLALKREARSNSSEATCMLLVMSMDADSQYGPLWIIGMPFFRKYLTTFEFWQKSESSEEQLEQTRQQLPRAATMAFSVANSDCRPGSPVNETKDTDKLFSAPPGSAHLHVDANKIRVPSLARRAHRLKAAKLFGRHGRPFIRI